MNLIGKIFFNVVVWIGNIIMYHEFFTYNKIIITRDTHLEGTHGLILLIAISIGTLVYTYRDFFRKEKVQD